MGNQSLVEKYFLEKSGPSFLDVKDERIPVITVDNYVTLGQLTALRFLEWVSENPSGVVALPTGKTPEYFIKWIHHYLKHWKTEQSSGLIGQIGFSTLASPPDFTNLHFVQLDEFFPIHPQHERSFCYYVNKYYIEGFGFDLRKALLVDTFTLKKCADAAVRKYPDTDAVFRDGVIDLGLRLRQSQTELEAVQQKVITFFDQFCEEYEAKIQSLGGIGFFLGGIGPDGHIAFNVRGTSHFSTTRLTTLNYESQAAAAQDMGGIEAVRRKAVITIGLRTIVQNPDVTAIIIAAGESKARVIADAVENNARIDFPASVLQTLPNARLYCTNGAATKLKARFLQKIRTGSSVEQSDIDKLIIDATRETGCSLAQLSGKQACGSGSQQAEISLNLAAKISQQPVSALVDRIEMDLFAKIDKGLRVPQKHRILHTAPHHDDIELAYFPLIHHLVRSVENQNYFCYMTSGFTSVTNQYVLDLMDALKKLLVGGAIFKESSRSNLCDMQMAYSDIHGYLNGIGSQNVEVQNLYTSIRLCRRIFEYLKTDSDMQVLTFVDNQIATIVAIGEAGYNPQPVQAIKGWIREWEAELVWAHFGLGYDHVSHLRLPFYSDQVFPEDPQFERDVVPILNMLERIRPTIVTLALDPEGSGPDTHYKTLMALTVALDEYVKRHGDSDLRIWGYRNVWSRFEPWEVDTIIPVSLNSFAVLHSMFNTCFKSQATASFPSHELNGTFSELAQKIWSEQFGDLTLLLGKDCFSNSEHPLMRRAFGAIYMKDMSYAEFTDQTRALKNLLRIKEQTDLHIE